MSPPAGPIYASSLHRRDRAWRSRRRAFRSRLMVMGGAVAAVAVLIQQLG